MSATTGSLCKASTTSAAHLPPSPFQHYWSLGVEEQFYLVWPPLIIGTAWLIRRARRRTEADATSSQRPYLVVLALVAVVSFALSLVTTYVMPAVAFFSLPTRAWQLAVGGLVALTAGQWRRLPPRAAAITGWAGLALILLACTRLSATTPYPGTAALLPMLGAALVIGAGCAAPSQGCGRVAGVVADARDRPGVVLVVSVALAGAGARTGAAGPPAGAGRQAGSGPGLRRAGRAHPAFHREPAAIRRADTPFCPAPVSRSAVPPPRSRSVWAWRCWTGCPSRSAAAPAAGPLTITAAPPPAGATIDAYDAAVQHAFAQVQAAVAASAELKAVPSNLNPPLADAAAEQTGVSVQRLLAQSFQAGQPECATGDTASTTTVALVGDSHAAMWTPAFQQIATQRHWRLEMLAKAGLPVDGPADHQPCHCAGEHIECEQWRGQIIARLRAEHPRLVVLSMWRGYGAGTQRLAVRFHVLRPGVDRQPDPPGAAAARHRCPGAGARADPGSAHQWCRSACPATSMTRRPARRRGRPR